MIRVAVVLLAVGLILAACAMAVMAPPEQRFRAKCASCHEPPRPGTRDRAGWEQVLDRHARRLTLTAEDRRLLLEHLTRPAR